MGSGADESKGLAAPLIPRRTTGAIEADASDGAATTAGVDVVPPLSVAGTALLAAGGLAASAAAMALVPTASVRVAGLVCVATAPWVAASQIRMFVDGGLREVKEMKRLNIQLESHRKSMDILKASLDDLMEEVEWLQEIEKKLDGFDREQGSNCDKILLLVNENESILNEMRNRLRETALVDITKLILESDKTADMTIRPNELKELTMKIRLQLSAHGIDLDEGKFKAIVRLDDDISHVLQVVAAIMFEESIGGQDRDKSSDLGLKRTAASIRRLCSNQDDSPSSPTPAEPVGRLRQLGSFAGDDGENKAPTPIFSLQEAYAGDDGETNAPTPMFSLQEAYTKGSVASARGRKTCLSKKKKCQSSGEEMRQMIQDAIDDINAEEEEEEEEASSAIEQDTKGEAVDFETNTMTTVQ